MSPTDKPEADLLRATLAALGSAAPNPVLLAASPRPFYSKLSQTRPPIVPHGTRERRSTPALEGSTQSSARLDNARPGGGCQHVRGHDHQRTR